MKKILKIILPVSFIIMTVFIFYNSTSNAEKSTKQSEGPSKLLVSIVEKVTNDDFEDGKNVEKAEKHDRIFVLVRKFAHFGEYAMQAVLLFFALQISLLPFDKKYIYVLFIGLFTGVSDEFLQSLVDGRSSNLYDVFIDFAGTITGICIAFLMLKILQKNLQHSITPKLKKCK